MVASSMVGGDKREEIQDTSLSSFVAGSTAVAEYQSESDSTMTGVVRDYIEMLEERDALREKQVASWKETEAIREQRDEIRLKIDAAKEKQLKELQELLFYTAVASFVVGVAVGALGYARIDYLLEAKLEAEIEAIKSKNNRE